MSPRLARTYTAITLFLTFLFALPARAAIQASENFDTNWPGAPWAFNSYSNLANPVSGWSISSNAIAIVNGYFTTPSNACFFAKGGGASLTSPLLSGGVGTVYFDTKANSGSAIFALESSYNGTSWFTNLIITNNTTLTGVTNVINSYSNQYFRIRRTDSSGALIGAIDSLAITYPQPLVTLSGLTNAPARPADQEAVTVSANVAIQSVADTFALTNYWREWPATNWSLIGMTSNSPTLYTAASAIPGKPIGALVEYLARATYSADGTIYTTNSVTNAYVVRPQSSFTNLSVTGQLAGALRNGANYQWQRVIQVASNNPTFTLQGISSGVTTTWGDTAQTVTNIPLYGTADVAGPAITLYTTNAGTYLFDFNETNLGYSVRSCAYENFSALTSSTYDAFGTYTNAATGWILATGNTSNDVPRVFEGSGRSAVLETNGWIRTPYLTNGIGQISFWYRNWPTNGTPTGSLLIQSSTNAVNWSTLGTVTGIVSTNYLFCSVAASDINGRYVRLVNTQGTARVCVDEVVVAQPGAAVNAANLTTTPASPTYLDPISISVDLTPVNGATLGTVQALYRVGTSGMWETVTMTTTDSTHYVLSAPINGVPTGTLYYAVQYGFSGFQAASPGYYPGGGTSSPALVTVAAPTDYRAENFDTNWPGAPWAFNSYSNVLNPVSGWSVSSNAIALVSGYSSTPSNACFFARGGQSALLSPLLTGGIGTLYFDGRVNSGSAVFVIESSYNGVSWFTNSVFTNATASLAGFTNIFNTSSNQYLRIRRTDPSGALICSIDTVRITYPPADVLITNVFLNPGYPVAGQTFTASCDVISVNPNFPAYNIAPDFIYGSNTARMTRVSISGTTNRYTVAITLPAGTRDTPYTYYVQTAFDGYYGSATEKRSPRTSTPATFTARAYASAFSNVTAIVNGATNSARLLNNGLWQTVVSFPTTNTSLSFALAGNGYSTGAGYQPSAIQWGNTNNWKTTLPLNDFAGTNQGAIALTGSFNGDYLIRYNELTGEYLVQQCAWQDFETWTKSAGGLYERSENINFPLVANNFDAWATNSIQSRSEDFNLGDWPLLTTYTNWAFGGQQNYVMYYSRIFAHSGADYAVQTTNRAGESFIAQFGRLPTPSSSNMALRGVGTVRFQYRTASTNVPVTLYVKGFNGGTNYGDYTASGSWFDLPSNSVVNATNTTFVTRTVTVNTNATIDIIFSHAGGDTNVLFDNLYVDEWYADSQTNSDWITSEGWIEQRSAGNLHCRFDATRDDGAGQYVMSPVLTNGVNALTFNYCGASLSPVSFDVDIRYGASAWTNLISVTNATTNYTAYSYTVGTSTNNARLRVRNTTPRPGILFVDDFKISAKVAGLTWNINNASIDDTDPTYPPIARQYFGGAGYLNSNKTSNINTDPAKIPDTNAWPYLLSPKLSFGVGEVSFWYRNWATNAPATPATLRVQTSTLDQPSATNAADWTTAYTLTNIINISDYQFLQLNFYDTTSKWVRLANDISTNAGRVCLDDVLIAAPMASSFAMSNLTVSPLIPLHTNTVDVYVDVYQLFLNPSNITMTALYGTATNYAGLSNASLSSLTMTCVASNLTTPGKWYRYKTATPISTNAIDTFVRYGARASWQGYNAQSASPRTNTQFATSPTWYKPLDTLYGTDIPYYIVYSCPTGAVWINEFNTDDADGINPTAQFVELCGNAGTRIANWQLQVFNDVVATTAVYRIPDGSTLPSTTNGFGFWVIGDTNVSASIRNQTLTNTLPSSGGLRLVRSCGVYEGAIGYSQFDISALTNAGFVSIGTYDDPSLDLFYGARSVGLKGTGSVYQAFSWSGSYYALSPGGANGDQSLLGTASPIVPPVIRIWSFLVSTNVWIECTRTSGWYSTPWYSTNLLNSNLWTSVAVFTNIPNASNDVLRFARPTNSAAYFYKVVSTNAP